MRPKNVKLEDSNEWKANLLEELSPTIMGLVDDNPGVIEYLSKNYEGTIFLYDYEEYESDLDVRACRDWEGVYEEVKRVVGIE